MENTTSPSTATTASHDTHVPGPESSIAELPASNGQNGPPVEALIGPPTQRPHPHSAYYASPHVLAALEGLRTFHQSHKARIRFKAPTRELEYAFSAFRAEPEVLLQASLSYEINLAALEGVSATRLALLMRDLPPGPSISADEAFIDAVVENCSQWHKHLRSYGAVIRSYRLFA